MEKEIGKNKFKLNTGLEAIQVWGFRMWCESVKYSIHSFFMYHIGWRFIKANWDTYTERELSRININPIDKDIIKMIVKRTRRYLYRLDNVAYPYLPDIIKYLQKVYYMEPVSEITNSVDDWMEVGPLVWQSRRKATLFSNDSGKTYYDLNEMRYENKRRVQIMHISQEA